MRAMREAHAGSDYILVVEDNKELREGLCEVLRIEGYQAVGAEHGEAALRHLSAGSKPCVILLDLMMPVMNGWKFHEEMRKDRRFVELPVIVMTAATLSDAQTISAAAVMSKPVRMDVLIDMVREHCPRGAP